LDGFVGTTTTSMPRCGCCGTVSGGSFTASGSTVNSFGCYGGWQFQMSSPTCVLTRLGGPHRLGRLHQVNASYYAQGNAGTVLTPASKTTVIPAIRRVGQPWLASG
jgi:hypothetical protein